MTPYGTPGFLGGFSLLGRKIGQWRVYRVGQWAEKYLNPAAEIFSLRGPTNFGESHVFIR